MQPSIEPIPQRIAILYSDVRREYFPSEEQYITEKDARHDAEVVASHVEKMGIRKGEMLEMRPSGGGKNRIVFLAPSRGLIGYHNEFMTDTRGTGIMTRLFHGYGPYKGPIEGRRNGVLISNSTGTAVAYALWNLEDRGFLFINPGVDLYEGMIIGEHSRENDLEVKNVLK